MKITYDIVITSIGLVHGEYPGCVDVSFHREGGNLKHGERDGFESARIALTSAIIKDSGEIDGDEVTRQVIAKVGETEIVEIESKEVA